MRVSTTRFQLANYCPLDVPPVEELPEEPEELLELPLSEVDESSVSVVLGGGIIQRVRANCTGRWLGCRF